MPNLCDHGREKRRLPTHDVPLWGTVLLFVRRELEQMPCSLPGTVVWPLEFARERIERTAGASTSTSYPCIIGRSMVS